MGSRGSNGIDRITKKLIPYDKWGKELNGTWLTDKEGNSYGYIEDESHYVYDNDVHDITKKEILDDIEAWRRDDGGYGDEDTAIYLAYDDGSVIDGSELKKKFKRRGLIGAYISTPDYQAAWGNEKSRRGELSPMTVTTTYDDGRTEERANTYSGYKIVGTYIARVKTTYNNPNGKGGYKTKRETIRKSTVKRIE